MERPALRACSSSARCRSTPRRRRGPVWSTPGERRATPFGAFLRRYEPRRAAAALQRAARRDVARRPAPGAARSSSSASASEIPGYMQKHLVKAGITGWAQVNDLRGDTDLAQRIQYDLYYIEQLVGLVRPAHPRAHAVAHPAQRARVLGCRGRGPARRRASAITLESTWRTSAALSHPRSTHDRPDRADARPGRRAARPAPPRGTGTAQRPPAPAEAPRSRARRPPAASGSGSPSCSSPHWSSPASATSRSPCPANGSPAPSRSPGRARSAGHARRRAGWSATSCTSRRTTRRASSSSPCVRSSRRTTRPRSRGSRSTCPTTSRPRCSGATTTSPRRSTRCR